LKSGLSLPVNGGMSGSGCAVDVQWMCSGCTVDVQWMCSGCTVDVQWMYSGCAVGVQWMCSGCTVRIVFRPVLKFQTVTISTVMSVCPFTLGNMAAIGRIYVIFDIFIFRKFAENSHVLLKSGYNGGTLHEDLHRYTFVIICR